MDLHEVREGIQQMLEHYRRSGVRSMLRSEPDPQVIARLLGDDFVSSATNDPAQPSVAAAIESPPEPVAAPPVARPHSPLSAPVAGVATSEPAPESATLSKGRRPTTELIPQAGLRGKRDLPWQLPILDVGDREARFDSLKLEVAACKKCIEPVNCRSKTVFGSGNLKPRVCFFGEAPGVDEDRQGLPFVGKAGELLTKIIHATGMKREEVYILNSLRCRPPGNRTPEPEEIENCRPFFEAQLEVLQPEYIVCLGAVAIRSLLESTAPIGTLRGRFHNYRGCKLLVTYHPAYLLRNESIKKYVWEDMQLLMRDMGLPIPKSKG